MRTSLAGLAEAPAESASEKIARDDRTERCRKATQSIKKAQSYQETKRRDRCRPRQIS